MQASYLFRIISYTEVYLRIALYFYIGLTLPIMTTKNVRKANDCYIKEEQNSPNTNGSKESDL